MRWFHYPIIIIVTTFMVIVIMKWVFPYKPIQPVVVQGTSAGKGYHNWLYIDKIGGGPLLTDIDGNEMNQLIVTFKNDELIFVNRMPEAVTVKFTDDPIFGAANKEFTIAPYKRVKRKVIGPPAEYSFSLSATSGVVNPPKVKVGEEP